MKEKRVVIMYQAECLTHGDQSFVNCRACEALGRVYDILMMKMREIQYGINGQDEARMRLPGDD